MQITKRDIELLKFINDFGFCEMSHIQRRFNLRHPRSYQVMSRLIKKELIRHERFLHARQGIYRLTQKGAEVTDLPPINRVPFGQYQHDLKIIDVYLSLSHLYPHATWISERKLQQDKHRSGLSQRCHIADGILEFDNKKVAIEVELSLKNKERLTQIIKDYHTEFSITDVWYFCNQALLKQFNKLTSHADFIKVLEIDSFLREPQRIE